MAIVLIIDDHPFTRMDAIKALDDSGYKIRTLTDVNLADRMIEAVKPDLVLVARQLEHCDSVRVFMHIRQTYPDIPVLHYALKSDTAIQSLQQSIRMAMNEARTALRRRKLPDVRMPGEVGFYNNKGHGLMKPARLPVDFNKR